MLGNSHAQPANTFAREYAEGEYVCPGSPAAHVIGAASRNAWSRVEVVVNTDCRSLKDEILARVNSSQLGEGWVDPHNGGVYSVVHAELDTLLSLKRRTGDQLFTDAIDFALTPLSSTSPGQQRCAIYGCSESQGAARGDFSTNYCNMRNLYCGENMGCLPMLSNFSLEEMEVTSSKSATHDAKMCINGPNMGKLVRRKRLLGITGAVALALAIWACCQCCLRSAKWPRWLRCLIIKQTPAQSLPLI